MAAVTPFTSNVQAQIDPKVYDNIKNGEPTLNWLMESSRLRAQRGDKYYVNLHTALSTVENWSGTTTSAISNVVQATTMKAVTFDSTGNYVVGYGLTPDDMDRGDSPLAVVKTSAEKHETAADAITSAVADDAFDGTGSNNTMIGLDRYISPTTSHEFGTLDADEDAQWAPQTSSTATVLNQFSDINDQIEQCTDNGDSPDAGITTETLHGRLLDIINQGNVINDGKGQANLGFDSFIYRGVRFWKDKNATADYLYILNGKYVGLLHFPNRLFADTGLKDVPNGYLHKSGMIVFRGNIWGAKRFRNGGFTSLTTS